MIEPIMFTIRFDINIWYHVSIDVLIYVYVKFQPAKCQPFRKESAADETWRAGWPESAERFWQLVRVTRIYIYICFSLVMFPGFHVFPKRRWSKIFDMLLVKVFSSIIAHFETYPYVLQGILPHHHHNHHNHHNIIKLWYVQFNCYK